MNKLSLILYLGNVAANCAPLLIMLGLIMAGLCATLTIRMMLERKELIANSRYRNVGDDMPTLPKVSIGGVLCGMFAVILWSCSTLIPSQETVYAIAASQMGEQALKTPLASKAGQALEAWLDRQMATSDTTKK